MIQFVILLMFACQALANVSSQWGYSSPYGYLPKDWAKYPGAAKCGSGKLQSPINIDDKKAVFDARLKTIIIEEKNLDNKTDQIWKVSSSNLKLTFYPVNRQYYFLSTPDKIRYNLTEFSVHWPSSETHLNGQSFAGEIHFKFNRTNNRIGYLAYFLKNQKDDSLLLNPIIDTIKLINKSGANSTSVTITSFSLFNLIPFKIDYYYRFDGSSTAPPCAENVDWFVVLYPSLSVSSKQTAQLQLMLDQNNQKVQTNVRPLQNFANRSVTKSFK